MGMIESRARATSDPEARREVLSEDRGGEGRVRPLLVHRPRGASEELRDHAERDGGRARRRHGLRRLVDHRLQRDRGVRHGRDARPGDVPRSCPAAEGEAVVGRMICDVVKPDGEPYEGDPRHVLRRALERMQQMGFDTFNVGPELEYFLFKDSKGTETPRRGRLLRDDRARRSDRPPLRDDQGARGGRDPDRVPPPRGRAVAARDRHALRARARHGRLHDHLPADRQGGRGQARRRTRPSCRSRSSARTGRACTRTCRCSRTAATSSSPATRRTTSRRPGSSSSPACSITRASSRRCSRSGSTRTSGSCPGFEAPVYVGVVAAEPLGARAHPALQARLGAGDAGRAALPGPGVQPVPHVRGAPPRRPRGDRARLRAAAADGDEPLPPHRRGAARARDRLAAGDARRGDRRVRGARS